MAKCYKKKPRFYKKKKDKQKDAFFSREKQLNKLINNFIYEYKNISFPPSEDEYIEMNHERLEIKRLLDLQSGELWKQSHRRKRFYYKQTSRFKYYYVAWKRYTYYIYLNRRYDMPLHLVPSLTFFKKVSHDVNYTIFAM